jgi:flagellar hook protein FlgE
MLTAIYTSQAGMTAFENGLTVIGNNVANLNTPGYKGTEPLFQDVQADDHTGATIGSNGEPTQGGGVTLQDHNVSFAQGQLQQTGNPLDAAIQGEGFFIVQRNGQSLYTRDGQFSLNSDGDLVTSSGGDKVLVSTSNTATGTFNINSYLSYAPQATTTVSLSGNLARTGQSGNYTLPSITVDDSAGGTETLSATFTQDSTNPLLWHVEVDDAHNNAVGTGTLTFGADGTPASGTTPIVLTVTPTNLPAFKVNLEFGTSGSYTGVTSLAGNATSQLEIAHQDGVAMGVLTQTSFDSSGNISLTYSNGKTLTPAKLLLAQFEAPEQLVSLGSGLYAASGNTQPVLGSALSSSFGSISDGQIEMSNIDLTKELTQLILLQRGYQASSQVTTVANDMMQQLLTMANQG